MTTARIRPGRNDPDPFPGTVAALRGESVVLLAQVQQAGLTDLPLVSALADTLASALHCLDIAAAKCPQRDDTRRV
jgi:hypothetical protein